MFLVVTRNFPPDIGGTQTLMGGLSESLLNHGPVKVFAYEFPNSNLYDSKSKMNIERIKGIKLFRKFRKANQVNSFINSNTNIRALIVDHWKSLELIKTENLKPVTEGDSDLRVAMKLVSTSGKGPTKQIPSMGCNIKWFK